MFRSIRLKLTIWYTCTLAIVFAAFALATYSLFVQILQDEARANIVELANNFAATAAQAQKESPRATAPETIILDTLDDFHFRDYHFIVYSHDGRLIGKTINEELPPVLPGNVRDDVISRSTFNGVSYNVLEQPLHLEGKQFKLVILFSLTDQISIESRIQRTILITFPVLLLIAGVGGYFLARGALKPIAVMGERAKNIGAENLHERLPIANPDDEIGNLAVLFNQLLDRLDQEFERQRRFMADASHELRTPLAIVRGESEVALQKDHRTQTEYKESLKIVNDEGKRLTKIVEDLFTLARVDSGNIKANFQELYINEIVEDCVTSIRTLADKRKIFLRFSGEELKVHGDETLLRRLFLNLLDNAVKYNVDSGTVEVTIKDKTVYVINTGPEIADHEKDLIFERFYRIDKVKARQTDTLTSGAGLGLSIARWIAEIHHAHLTFSRSVTKENVFSVIFPR